jgi:hypothetical protein
VTTPLRTPSVTLAESCCIKSGALREAIAKLLQAQANAISVARFPADPDSLVAHIAAVWFEENHLAQPIARRDTMPITSIACWML